MGRSVVVARSRQPRSRSANKSRCRMGRCTQKHSSLWRTHCHERHSLERYLDLERQCLVAGQHARGTQRASECWDGMGSAAQEHSAFWGERRQSVVRRHLALERQRVDTNSQSDQTARKVRGWCDLGRCARKRNSFWRLRRRYSIERHLDLGRHTVAGNERARPPATRR
jgi:hypothetical protein